MLYAYIMTGRVAAILQHLKSRLQALYGDRFTGVMLYGSHAREEASSESDIDVLIVLKGPVVRSQEMERTSHLVAGLCLEHDVVISRRFASEDGYWTSPSPLMRNVRREGVPI